MRYGLIFIAFAFQIGPVVLGYFYGIENGYVGSPPSIYTKLAIIAGLFMIFGVIISLVFKRANESIYRRWVCVGILVYSTGVVSFEPFLLWPGDTNGLVQTTTLMVPFLLVIPHLLRSGDLLSMIGVSLFVFVSVAMLTSNCCHMFDQSGFFKGFMIRF